VSGNNTKEEYQFLILVTKLVMKDYVCYNTLKKSVVIREFKKNKKSIFSYVTLITVQNDLPPLYVQFCASLDRTTREQCLPEGGLGVRVLSTN
jgi:hypothetical protein